MKIKYLYFFLKRNLLILCIIVPAAVQVRAQSHNLVKNSGFEEYEECPQSHNPENKSHRLVPGWSYPTHAAADYFNRCSSHDAGVPRNFAGESEPKDGDAYVGAILSGTSEERREYIQGEFTEPMIADELYCITYHYRLASDSKFAVDQISIYLSNTQVLTEGTNALGVEPQINNKAGLFLDNIEDWKRMCYVYKATGGEKFFIIGNFKDYQHTNYVATGKNVINQRNKEYAYYYFDDVSVKQLLDCNECPCVPHQFEVVITDTFYTGGLNPITGKINRIINDGRISLAIIGGTPPYEVNWSNNSRALKLSNLSAGTYTYKIRDKYHCTATGSVTFIEPEMPVDEFEEGLQNIEEGAAIVLENIFFEFNKTTLLPESYAELDHVIDFVIQNDLKKIEISGHTDNEGSESYNQKLSEGRANAVVEYLKSNGVSSERLISVGYGESKPIDTNSTEEGRAKNRRVEFRLIKK